ncbi:MAG: AsnC family transcriptional regulator [Candidatus Freyarchaeota archaeon]
MREVDELRALLKTGSLRSVGEGDIVLLEERFRGLLPDVLTEEDAHLLTSFFVFKCTGRRLVGADEERFNDLVTIDSMMGGEFLPSLVSRLWRMSKYVKFGGGRLSSEQLRQTILGIIFDYRVKLDETDLKILKLKAQNVSITKADIANRAGLSYLRVHERIKRLEERCRLGELSRVDYSKIGLTHLVALVEGEAFVESPYLLSQHELWSGKLYTLFSIAVPNRAVGWVEREFRSRFSYLWMWIVDQFEASVSFGFYDTNLKDWNIDWGSWSLHLGFLLTKNKDATSKEKGKRKGETPVRREGGKAGRGVTSDDLKLIDALGGRFDTPVRVLGERLGYSVGSAARAKRSLFERGILQRVLRVEHIGLTESILLIIESNTETLESFVTAAKKLPRAWIYWMRPLEDSRGPQALACWLETPSGTIGPLRRTLHRRLSPLAEYRIFLRSKQLGSTFRLLEAFDRQSETWMWSPEMLKIRVEKDLTLGS